MNSLNLSLNQIIANPLERKLVQELLKPENEDAVIQFNGKMWTMNDKAVVFDLKDRYTALKTLIFKILHHIRTFMSPGYKKQFKAVILKLERVNELQKRTYEEGMRRILQKETCSDEEKKQDGLKEQKNLSEGNSKENEIDSSKTIALDGDVIQDLPPHEKIAPLEDNSLSEVQENLFNQNTIQTDPDSATKNIIPNEAIKNPVECSTDQNRPNEEIDQDADSKTVTEEDIQEKIDELSFPDKATMLEEEKNDKKPPSEEIVIPPISISFSSPKLNEHSQLFLAHVETHLGKQAREVWCTLLNTFLKKYGADRMQSCTVEKNIILITLEHPLRIWFRSVDKVGDEFPIGGIIFSLGENKYSDYKERPKKPYSIKIDLKEKNVLAIAYGVESFVKTPQIYLTGKKVGKAVIQIASLGIGKIRERLEKKLDGKIPDFVSAHVQKFVIDPNGNFVTTGVYKEASVEKENTYEEYLKNWGEKAIVLENEESQKYIENYLKGDQKK